MIKYFNSIIAFILLILLSFFMFIISLIIALKISPYADIRTSEPESFLFGICKLILCMAVYLSIILFVAKKLNVKKCIQIITVIINVVFLFVIILGK